MMTAVYQTDAVIEVADLHKAYGGHEAVRGLSLTVRRGEVYGLLGPNGAGKTTTVEILEGFRAPTSGAVLVLGMNPLERSSEVRARAGMVLQSCGFHPHLTPREAVSHWAGMYRAPRDVDEVLALVGLTDAADRRSGTLSGGQSRRLDLALALVGDPEVVFLDEPTTGFDPGARRTAWETIRGLRALGKTILLTTHYLDEAQALADRVGIIKDGRLLVEGAPAELGTGAARYRIAYRLAGVAHEHVTPEPTRLLHELTSRAVAAGLELESLSVTRPSLEDVYLELTGDEVLAA